jgi:hypothetical protein
VERIDGGRSEAVGSEGAVELMKPTPTQLPAEVMTCCQKQNVANMDHLRYVVSDKGYEGSARVNRVCLNCLTHWYGTATRVRKYRGTEWDAMLSADSVEDSFRCRIQVLSVDGLRRMERIERAAEVFVKDFEDPECMSSDKSYEALKVALA